MPYVTVNPSPPDINQQALGHRRCAGRHYRNRELFGQRRLAFRASHRQAAASNPFNVKLNGYNGGMSTNLQLPASAYPNLTLTIAHGWQSTARRPTRQTKSIVAAFDGFEGGYWPGLGYINGGDWFLQVGHGHVRHGRAGRHDSGRHNVVAVFTRIPRVLLRRGRRTEHVQLVA